MSYAAPVKTYRKTIIERRRLYMDYSCFLEEDETLTNFQATVIPYIEGSPLTITTGYTDPEHKKIVIFVGGGAGNTNYTIQMVVTTSDGQVKRDDIGMTVVP